MPLVATAGLLAIFTSNVALGASGRVTFLGDVAEMLVLFAASLCFVAAILKREAADKKGPK